MCAGEDSNIPRFNVNIGVKISVVSLPLYPILGQVRRISDLVIKYLLHAYDTIILGSTSSELQTRVIIMNDDCKYMRIDYEEN